MKVSIVLLHLLLSVYTSTAFSPSVQRCGILTAQTSQSTRVFSQWDDEEEEVVVERTSFDDAGASLKEEDDNKKMEGMGDYDSNPDYNSADIDRVRDAIRQRTESLGIEKSTVSQEAIQAAQERAKAGIANQGAGGFQGLDLSQISQEKAREKDESTPAMFYNPADEMSEEEMEEADPDGQLSIPDQFSKEVQAATWPTPGAALKEVGLLIFVVVLTSSLIIGWDNFLRNTYTNVGFIPTSEDINKGSENMVLPEGWTKGMSEDDFMNFQDEVGSSASSSSPSVKQFQDL